MEDYLRKLANHAGIYIEIDSDRRESLSASLWEAKKSQVFPDLNMHTMDILQCLEAANLQINGPNPATRNTRPSPEISRNLAIFMSEIIRCCNEYVFLWEQNSLFTPAEHRLLKQSTWMIAQGWCMVVAGDFDNIIAEVQLDGEIKEIL